MRAMPCTLSTAVAAREDRSLAAWTLLAAVLCFAAMVSPFLLGQVYVADDLGEFHLPLRDFYSAQLAAGEPFDWLPGLFGGFYVTGEGQLGAYHPLHWLLYRWLPLGAAFDLELVASYPFLFVGTYLFLRRWQLPLGAAGFGALVFTFGGFNLLHFVHPNAVAIVAHLPWLLWTVDLALCDASPRRRAAATLGVGLLIASELLLGYPQYVWLSGLVVLAYAVWRAVSLEVAWTRAAWLLGFSLLGVVTAGVQLLPTYDLLSESSRRAPDEAFANTGSLHPLNLVQLVAPYLFRTRVVGQNTHELGLYLGAAPLVLALWLVTHRGRWGRWAPLVWAALAFGSFAFVLAMGEFGPLYRLQQWLPVVNRFRFPCRAIVLVQACAAVLAALGLAAIWNRPREHVERDRALLAAAVLASVVTAVAGPFLWSEFVADLWLVWTGPLLVATAGCLVALAERGSRRACVLIVVFTAADLCAYGLSYAIVGRTADLHEFVARIPRPPDAVQSRVSVPNEPSGLRSGDRTLLIGLARIDGYAGLEPARKLDYSSQRALQLAGVGWVLRPSESDGKPTRDWAHVPGASPRVRLITWAGATPIELPADGRAAVSLDRPGRLAVETHSEQTAVLATTESFHRGWRASVDGQLTPVVRVNHDFLGCEVPAGPHRVELIFLPDSLRLGKALTASGLGLMLCAALARWLIRTVDTR